MWFKTWGLKHIRFYHNKPYKSNNLLNFMQKKKLYQKDITPVPALITNKRNKYIAIKKIANQIDSLR